MSIRLMNAITQYGPGTSSERFVLLMIADNAADDGSNAFPSVETLAKKTALSERTVVRALNALVRDGYLVRRRRKDTSNIYQIVVEKLAPPVSDSLSPTVNDTTSPTQMTSRHPNGCHHVTYQSDTMSPDPSLLNHPMNHPGGTGGRAPAPADIPFQPIPPTVKAQKSRRGITDPEPALTATAPPAVRLLHQFTGYWPGDDITPSLVDRLGDAPDEVALRSAIDLWRLSGNKPTNWLGIIDWYDQLRRDPTWTPQARFRRDGPTGGRAPRPDEPLPAMKEIAPGVF